MILNKQQILEAMALRQIVIEPFDIKRLGTNSYDVRLGKKLKTYEWRFSDLADLPAEVAHFLKERPFEPLDCKKDNPMIVHTIPDEGFVLEPGELYLGVTQEYTESHNHVPDIDGKSSVGRLGISIHCTAGRGDVGFWNHWTLEITVVRPVRVYAGMPIGQLVYQTTGPIAFDDQYNMKESAKYTKVSGEPMASQMWRNFDPVTGAW